VPQSRWDVPFNHYLNFDNVYRDPGPTTLGIMEWKIGLCYLPRSPSGSPPARQHFSDSIIKPYVTSIVGRHRQWKRFNEKPATVMTASVYIRLIALKLKTARVSSVRSNLFQFDIIQYNYINQRRLPNFNCLGTLRIKFCGTQMSVKRIFYSHMILQYTKNYLAELFLPQG